MTWDDLKYLEALQRHGSVGRAARDLGVSSATVYRRVAALEEHLGVPCLQRGARRGDKLTEAGRMLATVGRSTRTSLQQVTRQLRAEQERVAGTVSLTTVEGFVPLLAAPIASLAEKHPDLTVEVHIGQRGPSVRDRAVDVALAVMDRPPDVLWGRRLAPIPYGLFGTAAALARAPRRWIVLGPPMHHSRQAQWESEHAGEVVARTGSRLLSIALARAGVGVAVLPRVLGARHAELIEDVAYREGRPGQDALADLALPAWVLTHPDRRTNASVAALMNALVEEIAHTDEEVS